MRDLDGLATNIHGFDSRQTAQSGHHPLRISFDLTTSTEQRARAATAAETLPSKNRSIRLWLFAPTKMQSALQSSASAQSNSFGSPAFTRDENDRPECTSFSFACATA